jgi:hypothetical protein
LPHARADPVAFRLPSESTPSLFRYYIYVAISRMLDAVEQTSLRRRRNVLGTERRARSKFQPVYEELNVSRSLFEKIPVDMGRTNAYIYFRIKCVSHPKLLERGVTEDQGI